MNLLTLLIIVGSLSVGILAAAVCVEAYKNARAAPASHHHFALEKAKRMMKAVREGEFPMHILENEANPPFNDKEYLEIYRSDMKNPATITYIHSVSERV